MQSRIARGFKAAIGANFRLLSQCASLDFDLRPQAVAIGLRSHRLDAKPVAGLRGFIPQKNRRAVEHGHDDVLAAIVSEVCDRRPSPDITTGQSGPRTRRNLGELAVPFVVEQERMFRVSYAEGMLINLRIYMPVSNENIFPSVIVEINELHPKRQERRADGAKPGWSGEVGKAAAVIVVVQIVLVVGKISLSDIGPAIVIVIFRVDSHACLFPAI